MKRWVFMFFLLFAGTTFCNAQTQTDLPPLDKSPMDMAYFPGDYPELKLQDKPGEPLAARVIYSRPQMNGRVIFGDLIEYGKVWRMGANEATEIEFFRAVQVGGKEIPKGRYTLYAIPGEDSWVIILNKETDVWGAFKYDDQKDIVRLTVPIEKLAVPVEALSMVFEKAADGCNLVVAWDKVKVRLPISIK